MKTTLKTLCPLALLLLTATASTPGRAQGETPTPQQLAVLRQSSSVSAASKTALLPLLKSSDATLRQGALEVLLEHPPVPNEAIGVLTEIVRNDAVGNIRGLAAAVLAQAGEKAQPPIKELLLGPNLRTRQTMATAVRALNPIPAELQNYVSWASPPHALEGPTLHPNSGFEAGLLGWEISRENGGQGDWSVESSFAKNGRNALRLTKTNGQGFIRLKSTFPIVLSPGTEDLTWRGWFHSQNAPLSSILLFRLVDDKGEMAKELAPSGSSVWQSQTLLRSTPDGVWDKRLISVKGSAQERRYFMEVVLYGNPCTVWLDDLDFPATPWNFFISDAVPSLPSPQTATGLSPSPNNAPLKVISRHNRVEMTQGDAAIPPVLHFPFVPQRGDFAAFEKAGVTPQTVLLEINDSNRQAHSNSAQTPVWPSAKSTTYHFDELFQRIERVAGQAPASQLMLNFYIMWPRDYVEAHPGVEWQNEKGEKGYGNWLYFSGFAKELPNPNFAWWPSPYLDGPVQDAGNVIRAFMQQLKTKPYANRVAGCLISGGQDGQFYIKDRDYSPAATKAWQRWLQQKYQTEENFRRAWKTPNLTFESAPVPRDRQAYQTPKNMSRIFFDPATETNQRDYEEFRTERMWRIKEMMLQAADEGMGRDLIGLTWNLGGALDGNIKPLLQSKYLDGTIVQPDYARRIPGYAGGTQAAYRSYARHGKLLVKEMDTRSWIRETYDNEISSMRISTPMSLPWYVNLFRKETGQMIAEDAAWWYFDISSNAFRHPGIMVEVAKEQNVYRETLKKPREFKPEVAFIYSNDNHMWSRTTHYGFRKIAQWMLNYQDIALSTSGVAADRFYMDDFMALKNWEQYKTIVFLNTYHLTSSERDFVNRELKKNNRTLIWHYAAGYLTDDAFGEKNISELVGMKIETDLAMVRQRAIAVSSNDALAKNLLPLQGMGDIFRTHFRLDDAEPTFDAQRFWIDDAQAVTLAQYPEDDKTAIAARRYENWTSVFVAPLGGISGELLNNAAIASVAYVTSEPNKLLVNMNDRFISLHALQSGNYQIRLPRKASATDVDSGSIIAANTDSFSITLQAQDTKWLRLE